MATRQERVDWLLAHQDLWVGWPPVGRLDQTKAKRELVRAMKRDGVLAQSTNWRDVAVTTLIKDAREQRREQKAAS